MMRKLWFISALCAVSSAASASADPGFSFDTYEVLSQSGEPLELSIGILPDPGSPLPIPCIRMLEPSGAEDGGGPLFRLYRPADEHSGGVYVASTQPIYGPVAHVKLAVGCTMVSEVDFDVAVPTEEYARTPARAPAVAKSVRHLKTRRHHRAKVHPSRAPAHAR